MRLFVGGIALAVCAVSADAQVCIGLPSNSVAPTNLGASVGFAEDVKTLGVRFGFGNASGFGGVTGSYARANEVNVSAIAGGVDAGINIPLNTRKSVLMCPIVNAGYVHGPNETNQFGEFRSSTIFGNVGLSLGGVADVSPSFAVIPNVNVGYGWSRQKLSLDDENAAQNERGAAVGGGVGLMFNQVFVISAGASIPVSQDDADPTFSIGFSIGFRR
ncbi:MAG: hypothetical protein ACO1Q7_07440 [Gemmatimonas sp.]